MWMIHILILERERDEEFNVVVDGESYVGAKPRWNGRREVFSSEMCSPIGNYTTKSTYPYDQQPQTPPPAAAAAAPVISDSEDITLFFFFFFFFLCPFLGAHTLGKEQNSSIV
ncbi:hypothetical protein LINPERHAP1_LOCUS29887 [Linum perenne]